MNSTERHVTLNPHAAEILEFWFGAAAREPAALAAQARKWFTVSAPFDEVIRTRFGDDLKAAAAGRLADFEHDPRSRLALIIVLDQFSRNIHRGTPAAFACDSAALSHARGLIAAGRDHELSNLKRVFAYMPFQHAEDRENQDRSVALFQALVREASDAQRAFLATSHASAVKHRDIMCRFGRFPHRNQILGRPNSAEEEAYLAGGGDRFGQAQESVGLRGS